MDWGIVILVNGKKRFVAAMRRSASRGRGSAQGAMHRLYGLIGLCLWVSCFLRTDSC